jgi:hypothetical protein
MSITGRLRLGAGLQRVPLILQTEAAECGLACLAMVAGAHGLATDLPTLRQRFSLSLKGVTLADLVRMADALQFNSRALRAELDELDQLQLPCILHWDLNHFVVLVSLKRGEAVIHDPARGLRRLKSDELSRHFTGVALELQPAPGFVPAHRAPARHAAPTAGAGERAEAFAGADPGAGAGARGRSCCSALLHAVGGGRRDRQCRPRPAASRWAWASRCWCWSRPRPPRRGPGRCWCFRPRSTCSGW